MTSSNGRLLIQFLAPARMARYRSFLKLSSVEEVDRAYAWNYALSAAVFPLLGCVEMQLRDAIHRVMSRRHAPLAAQSSSGCAWYDDAEPNHYTFLYKAKSDIESLLQDSKTRRRKQPAPTPDDVISSLTLGFWTNFIRMLTPLEGPQILPELFPHHRIGNGKKWGAKAARKELNDQLQIVNRFRNRVAHHEPLFKFRHLGVYPRSLREGLASLSDCMNHSLAIIGWMDPEAEQVLRNSPWFRHLQVLATTPCFDAWVRHRRPPDCAYLEW